MKYKVNVSIINIIDVEASSEEQAIEIVKNNLIASKQLKANDPFIISIVEESK